MEIPKFTTEESRVLAAMVIDLRAELDEMKQRMLHLARDVEHLLEEADKAAPKKKGGDNGITGKPV